MLIVTLHSEAHAPFGRYIHLPVLWNVTIVSFGFTAPKD